MYCDRSKSFFCLREFVVNSDLKSAPQTLKSHDFSWSVTWQGDFCQLEETANLILIWYLLILVDTELTLNCFAQVPSRWWWMVALALGQTTWANHDDNAAWPGLADSLIEENSTQYFDIKLKTYENCHYWSIFPAGIPWLSWVGKISATGTRELGFPATAPSHCSTFTIIWSIGWVGCWASRYLAKTPLFTGLFWILRPNFPYFLTLTEVPFFVPEIWGWIEGSNIILIKSQVSS